MNLFTLTFQDILSLGSPAPNLKQNISKLGPQADTRQNIQFFVISHSHISLDSKLRSHKIFLKDEYTFSCFFFQNKRESRKMRPCLLRSG